MPAMLKAALLLMSLVVSTGLVFAFGFAALAVVSGLCLLTVVVSCTGIEGGDDEPKPDTLRAALGM